MLRGYRNAEVYCERHREVKGHGMHVSFLPFIAKSSKSPTCLGELASCMSVSLQQSVCSPRLARYVCSVVAVPEKVMSSLRMSQSMIRSIVV